MSKRFFAVLEEKEILRNLLGPFNRTYPYVQSLKKLQERASVKPETGVQRNLQFETSLPKPPFEAIKLMQQHEPTFADFKRYIVNHENKLNEEPGALKKSTANWSLAAEDLIAAASEKSIYPLIQFLGFEWTSNTAVSSARRHTKLVLMRAIEIFPETQYTFENKKDKEKNQNEIEDSNTKNNKNYKNKNKNIDLHEENIDIKLETESSSPIRFRNEIVGCKDIHLFYDFVCKFFTLSNPEIFMMENFTTNKDSLEIAKINPNDELFDLLLRLYARSGKIEETLSQFGQFSIQKVSIKTLETVFNAILKTKLSKSELQNMYPVQNLMTQYMGPATTKFLLNYVETNEDYLSLQTLVDGSAYSQQIRESGVF